MSAFRIETTVKGVCRGRALLAATTLAGMCLFGGAALARVPPMTSPASWSDNISLAAGQTQSAKSLTMKEAAIIAIATPDASDADLERAAMTLRLGLKQMKGLKRQNPGLWAMLHQAYGAALVRLSVSKSGVAELEEAIRAYRVALTHWTRTNDPAHWGDVQADLGVALAKLGERENGTQRLREALAANREALTVKSRESDALEYARTENNIANSLVAIAERETATEKMAPMLDEAIALFRESLKERTREKAPQKWAQTQFNLGNALYLLGVNKADGKALSESLTALRDALKELSQERDPLAWAAAQNSLGKALRVVGEQDSQPAQAVERLKESVAAFHAALEGFTPQAAPFYHETAKENLARAEAALDLRRKMGGL